MLSALLVFLAMEVGGNCKNPTTFTSMRPEPRAAQDSVPV